GVRLLAPGTDPEANAIAKAPAASLAAALRTIIVADAVMGVDNVLAIGGAASGSLLLIVLGLAISVPIVVWGSHLVIRLVDRLPSIILLGGAVLAWTGYSMIVREPLLGPWLENHAPLRFVIAVLVFSLSLAPWYGARLSEPLKPLVVLLPALLVWLLGFEVLASVLSLRGDYLLAGSVGEYLLETVRWLGWLPPAAAFLWLRDRTRGRVKTRLPQS